MKRKMKRISALVLCFMMSVPLCAEVTLTNLRDAIEKGDTEKFKQLVRDIEDINWYSTLLKSTFPYTVSTFKRNHYIVTNDFTLLMLAVLRKNADLVRYMVKDLPISLNIKHQATFYKTYKYNINPQKIWSKTALQLAYSIKNDESINGVNIWDRLTEKDIQELEKIIDVFEN